MQLILTLDQKKYIVQLDAAQRLAIPLREGIDTVNCFYAPAVRYEPVVMGDFTGSVKAGAPVNFFNAMINPHGNGTHTECVGHISEAQESIVDALQTVLCAAQLVSIFPTKMDDGDRVITLEQLQMACALPLHKALILRTLPNDDSKLTRHYSYTNPPYLAADAAVWMRENGVEHLLLDLPSVDREVDAGALAAHHAFWHFPEQTRHHATITELIFVPESVPDGLYLLNLQIAPLALDASPSNPVIFPLVAANSLP